MVSAASDAVEYAADRQRLVAGCAELSRRGFIPFFATLNGLSFAFGSRVGLEREQAVRFPRGTIPSAPACCCAQWNAPGS